MSYISRIGTCVLICEGKLPAAILLHQILYQSNYSIKIGTRHWVARSRFYWEQNTGLSKKQVRSAVEYLLANKILICHTYNSMKMACSHYRINNIMKSLCPELVKDSPDTIFFGDKTHLWDSHEPGLKIDNYDKLKAGLKQNWTYAYLDGDLSPPKAKKAE